MTKDTNRTKRIAQLNDQFRKSNLGMMLMTVGISELEASKKWEILVKVRNFNNFTPGTDPCGEHDFGTFDVDDVGKISWRIDYYDMELELGSDDPADPTKTKRVLTVMLADEY